MDLVYIWCFLWYVVLGHGPIDFLKFFVMLLIDLFLAFDFKRFRNRKVQFQVSYPVWHQILFVTCKVKERESGNQIKWTHRLIWADHRVMH